MGSGGGGSGRKSTPAKKTVGAKKSTKPGENDPVNMTEVQKITNSLNYNKDSRQPIGLIYDQYKKKHNISESAFKSQILAGIRSGKLDGARRDLVTVGDTNLWSRSKIQSGYNTTYHYLRKK